MKAGGQLISVHPEELTFEFELDKPCYCNLKLVNKTEHHVAFKVKTTSPRKYFVRPNTSVVQPWDSCTITVTLQAQKEYPADMQCKDKFLLQSTKVPPNTDIDEIPQDTFNKDGEKVIEECKLRVVYATPSTRGNSEGESELTNNNSRDGSMPKNSTTEEIQTVQRLKAERDSTIQQNKQIVRELETLRRRKNRKGDAGFSLTFAAFVGLIGLMQKEYPVHMESKDKLPLQSTKVPPSTDIDEIPPDTLNKDGDKVIEVCKPNTSRDKLMRRHPTKEEVDTIERLLGEWMSTFN